MLGVIIGVAAVILLIGIGTGVQDMVTGSLEGLGSNLLFVMPGQYDASTGGSERDIARSERRRGREGREPLAQGRGRGRRRAGHGGLHE